MALPFWSDPIRFCTSSPASSSHSSHPPWKTPEYILNHIIQTFHEHRKLIMYYKLSDEHLLLSLSLFLSVSHVSLYSTKNSNGMNIAVLPQFCPSKIPKILSQTCKSSTDTIWMTSQSHCSSHMLIQTIPLNTFVPTPRMCFSSPNRP